MQAGKHLGKIVIVPHPDDVVKVNPGYSAYKLLV